MFTESAKFYDAIYGFKNYQEESELLLDLLKAKRSGTLLDVACGTGKHLEYLSKDFSCEGLDLDQSLLRIAESRLPGMRIYLADMTGFDLGKQFDAVVCLFSAIGFAETVPRLNSTMACIAKHTKAGGLVIVEPWLSPEVWNSDHLHALFVDEPDLKLARMSWPGREGNVSTICFEYLISTRDGIERATEHHRLGLFTKEEYVSAFKQAGLAVEYMEGGLMGRGLYLGSKPDDA